MDESLFGLGVIFGILVGLVIGAIISECQIQPIDVYRGKTELVVTYKNDVAVDSTVVYKIK